MRPGGCQPVRFNPCEPVHYVVNAALAPPGALDDLAGAFDRLSAATGIDFVDDGPSGEPASLRRAPVQPERYGNRYAPILIVCDRGDQHGLERTNPGGGRPTNVGGVYGSGVLILNVDAVTDDRRGTPLDTGFGEGATWGRVMLHELAHLVGLGHVRTSRGDHVPRPRPPARPRGVPRREGGCLETPPPRAPPVPR